jgi:hypothetical protein
MAALFQFSIRSLLVGVTIAAVGIAALLNANAWWEGGAWVTALFLLGCSILLAAYRRDEKRAYWLGFAIFGGLYLGAFMFVAVYDWSALMVGGLPGQPSGIVTTRISQLAYYAVIPESRRAEYVPVPGAAGQTTQMVTYAYAAPATAPTGATTYSPPPPVAPQAVYTVPVGVPVYSTTTPPVSPLTPNASYVSLGTFVNITHALWLLLAAAIGGKVCQLIYRTRPPAEK